MQLSKKNVRRQERRAIERLKMQVFSDVEKFLQEYGRRMFNISEADNLRMLMLYVWSERYHVEIEFILATLLPLYWKKFKKTSKRQTGIGVRMTTLFGAASEKILSNTIEEKFPRNEHILDHQHERRMEYLTMLDGEHKDDDFKVRVKGILDFASVKDYVAYYQKKTLISRRALEKQTNKVAKKKLPYRSSPWR